MTPAEHAMLRSLCERALPEYGEEAAGARLKLGRERHMVLALLNDAEQAMHRADVDGRLAAAAHVVAQALRQCIANAEPIPPERAELLLGPLESALGERKAEPVGGVSWVIRSEKARHPFYLTEWVRGWASWGPRRKALRFASREEALAIMVGWAPGVGRVLRLRRKP